MFGSSIVSADEDMFGSRYLGGHVRNILGQPVKGDDFWPRPDVVDPIVDHLVQGTANIKMFGLRRIGKSSVLLELEHRLQTAGMTVVHIDAQKHTQFRSLMAEIVEGLPSAGTGEDLRKKFGGNKLVTWLIDRTAEHFGAAPRAEGFVNEFNHHAAWSGDIETLLKAATPLVLILDELPIMARSMLANGYRPVDIEQFLATLRSWRFRCGVRMVFAGSLGFGALERDHGVNIRDNISDPKAISIPPLLQSQAVDFVDALATSKGLSDWSRALSEWVVAESAETWPIFLQYGFDAVVRAGARTESAARQAIRSGVRDQLDENFYTQFGTRLARYRDQEKAARVILKALVASDRPAALQTVDAALEQKDLLHLRDDLLEYLRDDDFIEIDTQAGTIRAASKLVPIWVRARAWAR